MTLTEEAIVLRDRICATVPQRILDGVGGDKWMAALLVSKEYWSVTDKPVTVDSAKASMAESVKYLFTGGMAPQYISHVFNVPVTGVVNMLVTLGFPVVLANQTVTLDLINRISMSDEESISNCDSYMKTIKQLSDRMKYVSVESTEQAVPDQSPVRQMAFSGYSAGDIAAYTSSDIKDILILLHDEMGDKEARECRDVIEDWMSGKSTMFLAMKYSTDLEDINDILMHAGYVTSTAVDCNIRQINKHLTHNGPGGSLRRGYFTAERPSREYLLRSPRITFSDGKVIERMLKRQYPIHKLADATGVDETSLSKYLSERGLA